MPKIERRCADFICRHIVVIALAAAVLVSLFIRWQLRGFVSGDMEGFLLPWMKSLKSAGIAKTVHIPRCNYNVLYLMLLKLFSYIPVTPVVQIKLLSVLFDYLAAGASALIVYHLMPNGAAAAKKAAAAGAIMLLLPVVIANSTVWGQCDVIYTFFLLMCVFFAMKDRYTLAFLMFSLAICFKLQAVFMLPALAVLYFSGKKFSILQFLQAPALVTLLGLFVLQPGDGPFLGIEIYVRQATQGVTLLYFEYPNLWIGFPVNADVYGVYASIGITVTLAVFACFLAFAVHKRWRPEKDALLLLAAWCIFTCAQLLPNIHERYAFAAEWLLCLYFLVAPSVRRFIMLAPVHLVMMLRYLDILIGYVFLDENQLALASVLCYALITGALVLRVAGKAAGVKGAVIAARDRKPGARCK